MESEQLISVIKEKGYKRYYLADIEVEPGDKKFFSLFRQEILLKIVLFLLKHPNARHKDIAEHLDITTNVLSYHLEKLVEHGIVTASISNEERGYSIINKKKIRMFLQRYQLQTVIERFAEAWEDFQ
jgi:predicted transcriptional regulator